MTSGQLLTLFLAMSQRLHLHGHVTTLEELLFSYGLGSGPRKLIKEKANMYHPCCTKLAYMQSASLFCLGV